MSKRKVTWLFFRITFDMFPSGTSHTVHKSGQPRGTLCNFKDLFCFVLFFGVGGGSICHYLFRKTV